jgi:hypothetical protein
VRVRDGGRPSTRANLCGLMTFELRQRIAAGRKSDSYTIPAQAA